MGTYSGFECDCCGRRFEFIENNKYENDAQPVIISYGVQFGSTELDLTKMWFVSRCWCRECIIAKNIWTPIKTKDKKIGGIKKGFFQAIKKIKFYFGNKKD